MKKTAIIFGILAVVSFLVAQAIESGLYQQDQLRWSAWWQRVQKEHYSNRLSSHDISIVERCATSVGVTPDRVISTLLYRPSVPNSSHWEEYGDDRFVRIAKIQRTFSINRGVAYRLMHRGCGSKISWLVGQADGPKKKEAELFERKFKLASTP